MNDLHKYKDIHSHLLDRATRGDTVVNIVPGDEMKPSGTYSVGIHPWESDHPINLYELKQLVSAARDARVVAIGECGFDRLRGGTEEQQRKLFDFHARLAKKVDKPLIIHSVKSDDLLLAAAKRHKPSPGSWIIHGFRGKPEAAESLLRAGFSLSYGKKYHPESLAITPPARTYYETDDIPD